MTEQLKPCPFCGSTNIRAHVYGGGEPDAFMQCHDCSADGPNGLNREGAIEAWNRRTQPAQVPSDTVSVPLESLARWRAAFAEELAAWDIDPPLHHVKASHDEIDALLAKMQGDKT